MHEAQASRLREAIVTKKCRRDASYVPRGLFVVFDRNGPKIISRIPGHILCWENDWKPNDWKADDLIPLAFTCVRECVHGREVLSIRTWGNGRRRNHFGVRGIVADFLNA